MKARYLFMMLLLISSLLIVLHSGQFSEAAETNQTFVIHKRVYKTKNDMPSVQGQNELAQDSPQLKNSTGINNAVYTIYDVTKNYWQLVDGDLTSEDILTLLERKANSIMSDVNKVAEATTATDPVYGSGIIKVTLPEKVMIGNQEKYAVYLFHEKYSPLKEAVSKSTTMLVSLPLEDVENEDDIIHLYPKSTTSEEISLTKKLDEEKQDFSYGEPIKYVIGSKIPENIAYLANYTLTDTFDAPLEYSKNSVQIFLNDVDWTSLFTLTVDETTNKMVVETTGEILRAHQINAGAVVKIAYRMVLSGKAEPDIYYKNIVHLKTTFTSFETFAYDGLEVPELEAEALPVVTAGKQFIKTDMEDQEKRLQNATFLVKNADGEYLARNEDTYSWQKEKKGSYRIKSDKNGHFSIKGLHHGTYFLEEVEAPVGYKLLDNEVSFKLEEGSYRLDNQETAPLNVMNAKQTVTSSNESSTSSSVRENISKPQDKDYPKMGEAVGKGIAGLGMCIMVVAGIYLLRGKTK